MRIHEDDVITSVADALQYISYYHPPDFLSAMAAAYERERNPIAKDAIAQILINSRLCAEGHRPICQDTGIVVAFARVGMQVEWDARRSLPQMIDEGVRRAFLNADNPLRASILAEPAGARRNTLDNTPAVTHVELVPGDGIELRLAAKGGGSENKSAFTVLNPSDSVVDWVLERVPRMGAGWCPPGMLGIGIGGTAEKALLLAKEALFEPIDMAELKARGPRTRLEELRVEIYDAVNALGIGAQGLGGLTTVLDVKIRDYPTHATSLPVGVIPNCAATRHIDLRLDGSGPARLPVPSLKDWPQIAMSRQLSARRVDLESLTRAEVRQWRVGERLLLKGRLITARDAAHRRVCALLESGQPLPAGLSFQDRVVYYVGPVAPVGSEAIGPAGPTTATRMDRYTECMLARAGAIAMLGKAERDAQAIESIRCHGSAYLIGVGGAAYLLSKAVLSSRIVAFSDLGMEAVHELQVRDLPVTVAVDSSGGNLHESGPRQWRRGGVLAGIAVRREP